jgi:hypothetical protein
VAHEIVLLDIVLLDNGAAFEEQKSLLLSGRISGHASLADSSHSNVVRINDLIPRRNFRLF